ncbi:hypothetical protein B0A49_13664 [Cryomyces minteri]|uniref:Bromo domain-containing protein n=1 Tax=Cryomyces minteri TaxID=331657 RepID=A0A4V5N6B3_9PEZI|nr:hypothetical protein B0A49_13664 [Cryomyces minteri]
MPSPQATLSPPPLPSTEKVESTNVADSEWRAMTTVLNNVYAYRTEDGHDPSKIFSRKVNKRAIPSYYEVIKEPIALSTIKASRGFWSKRPDLGLEVPIQSRMKQDGIVVREIHDL